MRLEGDGGLLHPQNRGDWELSYASLRDAYHRYNSGLIANSYKFASEMVKGCIKACEVNKRSRFPDASKVESITLRKKEIAFDGERVKIIYKPGERIEVPVFPSERQKEVLKGLKSKGARLVRRDDHWTLHLIVEKEVVLPRWEECETVVGVDIGVNFLAVATAITKDGKVHAPLYVKGGEWKHLQLKKRAKMRVLQSRGANTRPIWTHLNNRFEQILHDTSKRVVEYAKGFPKPIIVLENISNLRNSSYLRKWNFLLGNWARAKLQRMIEYKANWEGIQVIYRNPAYTSVKCFYCGERGTRNGKDFSCPTCGRRVNADWNGSANLAKRFRHLLATKGIPRGLSTLGKSDTHMEKATSYSTMHDEMNSVIRLEGGSC